MQYFLQSPQVYYGPVGKKGSTAITDIPNQMRRTGDKEQPLRWCKEEAQPKDMVKRLCLKVREVD